MLSLKAENSFNFPERNSDPVDITEQLRKRAGFSDVNTITQLSTNNHFKVALAYFRDAVQMRSATSICPIIRPDMCVPKDFRSSKISSPFRNIITKQMEDAVCETTALTGVVPPRQAAQFLFPKITVPLQKYLRLTRLQHLHPPDAILSRLAICLAHSASPEAFLSVFRSEEPSATIYASFIAPRRAPGVENTTTVWCCGLQSMNSIQLAQSWHLHILDAEDSSRSRGGGQTSPAMLLLKPGTRFHLSRAGVTLFCHIQLEPLLSLRRAKRVLRIGGDEHIVTTP
ncbi:hypothetical protein ACTXT7_009381 [Hymenolepis weldensis]